MRKAVFFEELIYLEDGILTEILAISPPKVLACALFKTSEEFRKKFKKNMDYRLYKSLQDEEEKLALCNNKLLALGAQKQILKLCRKLESKNQFIFSLDDCPRFHQNKP